MGVVGHSRITSLGKVLRGRNHKHFYFNGIYDLEIYKLDLLSIKNVDT